jgi:hypothetical protein
MPWREVTQKAGGTAAWDCLACNPHDGIKASQPPMGPAICALALRMSAGGKMHSWSPWTVLVMGWAMSAGDGLASGSEALDVAQAQAHCPPFSRQQPVLGVALATAALKAARMGR